MGAWSSRPTAHAVAGVLWMLRHELKPTSNWGAHELAAGTTPRDPAMCDDASGLRLGCLVTQMSSLSCKLVFDKRGLETPSDA